MNSLFHRSTLLSAALLTLGLPLLTPQAGAAPAKIFILAGQSNMVGQGWVAGDTKPGSLEHTVANDPNGDYQFLVDGGGAWVQRADVWYHSVSQADGNTPLKVGLGFDSRFIGPELGFGHAMGDLHEELVILVKVAQGGRDLADDFLPPSSGPYAPPVADQDTGYWYKRILDDVAAFIASDLASVPGYNAADGYEIAGFGWHQGWNDRGDLAASEAYETNLVNLINDLRDDLVIPDLPFVIATTGMDGFSTYTEVENAQLAVADATKYPDFEGNVAVIDTRSTYEGLQFWYGIGLSPGTNNFHWNDNAKTYLHIGMAMADAMSILQPARCPFRLRAEGGAGGVTLSWQNGTEMPTSVQILRDGVELAAAAPVDPPTFLDSGVTPGVHNYTLNFTMPGTPCDPLTLSFNGGITGLKIDRQATQFVLSWANNMDYAGIEVRRDGALLDTLPGSQTSYIDTAPPGSGTVTYSVAPTTGSSDPAILELNLSLAGQLGVLDLTADFGINPMTGELWKVGDTYRLIFTTSTTRNATSSNVADYNAFVNAAADGSSAFPKLGDATWYALASTPTVDARDNTLTNKAVPHPDAAVYLTDGSTLFAGNNNDLWSGNNSSGQDVDPANGSNDLIHVRYDENGAAVALGLEVWTGTHQDGYGSGTLGNGGDCTIGILVTTTDGRHWMRIGSKSQTELKPLYAISEMLTVSNTGAADDQTPPEPGVMTWETEPTATSATAITMTADIATDASGVQYRFVETSGNPGGTSSEWQDSRTYVDDGLEPETTYTYTVQAKDKSGNDNTNTASAPASATTPTLPAGPGGAVIYESFDYGTGSVSGGSGGIGFTGNWSINNEASTVVSPGLSWGSLPVAGNSVTNTSGGSAARDIGATSVLDDGSLMGNGATLWFSVVMKNAPSAITNVDLNFSLGSDPFLNFVAGPGGTFSKRTHLASGEGIGFSLRNVNSTTGRANGAYWQDTDADTIANRVQIDTSTSIGVNQTILIVGRIDWGADDLANETLTLYAPDTDLNLGTAILAATAIPALDQSAFDTVAFQLKGGAIIDEIRFGATADDVLGLGGSASDYDTWAGGPFLGTLGDSSPDLDFDGGGLDTGIEWVVGGDPTDGSDDSSKAPVFDNTTDPDKFLFIFRRSDLANADENTTITAQYGSSLSGWFTAAHEGTGPTQISVTEVDDFYATGIDKVTVAIPRGLAVGETLFARLKVAVMMP